MFMDQCVHTKHFHGNTVPADNNLQPMAFLVRTALGKYGKGAKLAMCFLGRKCDATSHKQSGLSIFTYGADFEDWFEDVNCATGNYM